MIAQSGYSTQGARVHTGIFRRDSGAKWAGTAVQPLCSDSVARAVSAESSASP